MQSDRKPKILTYKYKPSLDILHVIYQGCNQWGAGEDQAPTKI